MRMFDISPTISIDLDQVEAIQADDIGSTLLIINGKSYQTPIAFPTMKSLVQGHQHEQPLVPEVKVKTSTLPEIISNEGVGRYHTDPAW